MEPLNQHRHIGVLCDSPLIIMSCVDSFAPFERNLADVLAEVLSVNFVLVLQIWQSWERIEQVDPAGICVIALSIARHERRYPANQIWIACNTEAEVLIARKNGIKARKMHHNAFVNENQFYPQAFIKKNYDAVYSAQMWLRKRHELAAKIRSISLIFALHLGDEALRRFAEVRSMIPHAHLANGDPNVVGSYRYMTPSDMRDAYNAAHVGLCLSEHEGGSLASAEYLLCGLPVISTPNFGGRDELFDSYNSLTCEPRPDAISKGVSDLLNKNLDPLQIRRSTLVKIRALRSDWLSLIAELSNIPTADLEHVLFERLLKDWCGLKYKSVSQLMSAIPDEHKKKMGASK